MEKHPDGNRPSDERSQVSQELAQAQEELRRYRLNLAALHRLTHALACASDEEGLIKILARELPTMIDAVLVGIARSHRNRIWIWSGSQNREQEARVRRYLLRRIGQLPSPDTAAHAIRRGVRSRHLYLVPPSASQRSPQEQDSSFGQEVSLAFGAEEIGLLLVQPKDPDRFAQREREAIETVGAALSLALRHAETQQQARDISLRDPLTGMLNPQAFDGALARELSVGLRYRVSACLLLLNLDFFKTVNDRLGHTTGDQVLKTAADLIRATVRESDIVGRYGGNTFAVLLPHTDKRQALALAERLRDRVERHPFEIEAGQVRTTASIGLAAVPDAAVASVADWMLVGDAALRDAKVQGRNRVVLHVPSPPGVACAVALSCAA